MNFRFPGKSWRSGDTPWMEIHENSIHDNSWDWLLRHRSPRLSKVLRRMIGWVVIIGKVVQLDQQKNWSSFLQEILPSDYVSAAVPLQNHRTSFWNFCKKSILFPLYASFMGLQVLSSFVSLAFCVLIILGGKWGWLQCPSAVAIAFSSCADEASPLRKHQFEGLSDSLCRFNEKKARESFMKLSACHVCIGRDRSG